MNQASNEIINEVKKVIHGKDHVIKQTLAAIFAGGHILLEDIPGVGKTTLAMSFARAMALDYRRMQFTPDVLPSDLVGFNMYDKSTETFKYREGAVYTNLFLADEINRTSPKTQSALLEVMEEGRATVEGVTRDLPTPFFVIATENPFGSSGTQKLPESQLDRFMICLTMGYPDKDSAISILKGESKQDINDIKPILSGQMLTDIQHQVAVVKVDDSLYEYIVALTDATRDTINFSLGLSPRGSKALLKVAKAMAFIDGRDFLTPEDIQDAFMPVLIHRVKLSSRQKAAGVSLELTLRNLLSSVSIPKL